MSDRRTPRERLDALLAGLEDEVLRAQRTGQRLADEGVATEDVGAMRSAIESLIHARTDDPEPRPEPLRGADAPGAKARVTQAMQRLGRWAGRCREEARAARCRRPEWRSRGNHRKRSGRPHGRRRDARGADRTAAGTRTVRTAG